MECPRNLTGSFEVDTWDLVDPFLILIKETILHKLWSPTQLLFLDHHMNLTELLRLVSRRRSLDSQWFLDLSNVTPRSRSLLGNCNFYSLRRSTINGWRVFSLNARTWWIFFQSSIVRLMLLGSMVVMESILICDSRLISLFQLSCILLKLMFNIIEFFNTLLLEFWVIRDNLSWVPLLELL